jgi:hypothetical protein
MTTTENGHRPRMIDVHSHCIVGCGWADCDGDHGDYCERLVGGKATGVTEPGWSQTQFWCSAISSWMRGTFTQKHRADCERYRDGVQLIVNTFGEIPVTSPAANYHEVKFNLTPGEARQLAATLIGAADDHDRRGDTFVMSRLEKIADHLGADIFGTSRD